LADTHKPKNEKAGIAPALFDFFWPLTAAEGGVEARPHACITSSSFSSSPWLIPPSRRPSSEDSEADDHLLTRRPAGRKWILKKSC